MGNFKKTKSNKTKRIRIPEAINYDEHPPKFSLQHIQSGKYCFTSLTDPCKIQFATSIYNRKNLAWKNLKGKIQRHGLGSEKIEIKGITAPIPRIVSEDSHKLLAFRYNGKKAMVGFRVRDVFHVLWFDKDFTLYDHG